MTLPNDTKQKHLLKERKCTPSRIYPNKDFAFPLPQESNLFQKMSKSWFGRGFWCYTLVILLISWRFFVFYIKKPGLDSNTFICNLIIHQTKEFLEGIWRWCYDGRFPAKLSVGDCNLVFTLHVIKLHSTHTHFIRDYHNSIERRAQKI